MKRTLELLGQIITLAEEQDKEMKILYLKTNKASKSVGESSLVFHLKTLRELILEEFDPSIISEDKVTIGDRVFDVSLGEKI